MIKIQSRVERYALSLPQSPREIPANYFSGVVECINLPKNYAIIALVRQVRFYDFLMAISNPKAKIQSSDLAILAKHNFEYVPEGFSIGQQVIIDESSVARGNQIVAPCALSYDNIVSYFLTEEKIVRRQNPKDTNTLIQKIMTGIAKDENNTPLKEYPICFVSFKIVSANDIHGTVDVTNSFKDPFVELIPEKKEAEEETTETEEGTTETTNLGGGTKEVETEKEKGKE